MEPDAAVRLGVPVDRPKQSDAAGHRRFARLGQQSCYRRRQPTERSNGRVRLKRLPPVGTHLLLLDASPVAALEPDNL